MNRTFSAELYRLRFNGEFLGCLVFVLISGAISLLGGVVTKDGLTASKAVFSFSSLLPFFLAISIANIACGDYARGTLKNVLSSGNSRAAVYGGKLLVSLVACTIYFVADLIAVFAINAFMSSVGKIEPVSWAESIFAQLLIMLIYTSIFFAISSMVKSSKLATIICFAFQFFVSTIQSTLGNLLDADLSSFSLNTLASNAETLNFGVNSLLNAAIYIAFGAVLNLIAYRLFKNTDI